MGPRSKKLSELSGEELETLLVLIDSSDSVELKVTLADHEQQRTVAALGLDPLQAQIRQVFFLDTPDLKLHRGGVAVRARRIQGRSGDTVVKLRPVVPSELPEDIRRSDGVSVEVDAMPEGYVCSVSMKEKVANGDVRDAVNGRRALHKLFSKDQRAFLAAHAPEGAGLDELEVLGPVFVLKLVLQPRELGRRLVAELWLLPDGTRTLELSTKCAPAEAFQVAVETRAYFAGRGLNLSGESQTKTKTALEYFTARRNGG